MRNSKEILEEIYHKGQRRSWDGKNVLEDLLLAHGVPRWDPEKIRSISRIFTVILQGEKAAWNIALSLANSIDDVEAKMAVTSQAHDEARHFYVMRDYFSLSGIDLSTEEMPRGAGDVIASVAKTKNPVKKLELA